MDLSQHDRYSDGPRSLCIICSDWLSNEAMKPSKLFGHWETKHPALKNRPSEYFESKKAGTGRTEAITEGHHSRRVHREQDGDQLMEVAKDGCLKSMFQTTTLLVFWVPFMAEHPMITATARAGWTSGTLFGCEGYSGGPNRSF